MSHFSVLILGPEPELQLDPYAELDPSFDGPLAEDYRAEFIVDAPAGSFAQKAREIIAGVPETNPTLALAYRELLKAGRPEAVLKRWFGGEAGPGGDWGHYANPVAKWDWFVLGGRCGGSLLLLPGRAGTVSPESDGAEQGFSPRQADQARFGDIDWAATRQAFTPFAVLKDGEWYEQGQMGWWAIVANAKDDAAWEAEVDALLAGLPPDTLVSVYDCHI